MELKLSLSEKSELAEWLAKMNSGCVTGSLMLLKRNINIEREPNDIDIVVSNSLKTENIVFPPIFVKNKSNEDGVILKFDYLGTTVKFICDDRTLEMSEPIDNSECRYATIDRLVIAKFNYLDKTENDVFHPKTTKDLISIMRYKNSFN